MNNQIKTLKKRSDILVTLKDLENLDTLCDYLSDCHSGNKYTILCRISYLEQKEYGIEITQWKTIDKQIPFSYDNYLEYRSKVETFQNKILSRLTYLEGFYHFTDASIHSFQLLIFLIEYNNKIVKNVNIKSLGYNKDLIDLKETNDILNRGLPITLNKNEFGNKLSPILDENGEFNTIVLEDNTELKLFNNNSELNSKTFKPDIDVYQNKDKLYVVDTKISDEKLVNNISILNTKGFNIGNITDQSINESDFKRKFGNITVFVNKEGVYNKEIDIKLASIKPRKLSKISSPSYPDFRIGSFDLETYYDKKNNISKVYAAGFKVSDTLNTYYLETDSDDVILRCINDMLKDKYSNYTFYVHNLGKFDFAFIIGAITRANLKDKDKYKCEFLRRDGRILKLSISGLINKRRYRIKLVDSINILNNSLDKLCKSFNTPITKGSFPHTFVTENRLNYIGDKPDISFFKERNKELSAKDYNEISNIWDLKKEALHYLERDLISLYNIIHEFSRRMFVEYSVQTTNSVTISSLAMEVFLRRFYNNNIPLIRNKSIYYDLKESYFGGITEVYRPHGKKLYYYDVNSLYPFVALNDMPGINCKFIEKINVDVKDCDKNFFGFYYCEVEAPKMYVGLLPLRDKDRIIMPLGNFEGWYFSEELKFASKQGYKINIKKGYEFNRQSEVFTKYVQEFYKIKSTTKDQVLKTISKSMLNNLLGRFGLKIERTITKLMTEQDLQELLSHSTVHDVLYMNGLVLVDYEPGMSTEVCKDNNVDYIKTFNNLVKSNDKDSESQEQFSDISIAISSAVTSYARIYMNKIKLDILEKGGKIFYTDTDSIVTDIELPKHLVGKELGQFKLEHNIIEGYFISNKTYALKCEDENSKTYSKIVTKGVNGNMITFDLFKELYKGKPVSSTRYEAVTNYSVGSVNLNIPRTIELKPDSYTKREKIFDKSKWVNTKPILYKSGRKYSTFNRIFNKSSNIKLDRIFYFFNLVFLIILIINFYLGINTNCFYDYIAIIDNGEICYNNFEIKSDKMNSFSKGFYDFINLFNKYGNNKTITNVSKYNIINNILDGRNMDNNFDLSAYKNTIIARLHELYIMDLEKELANYKDMYRRTLLENGLFIIKELNEAKNIINDLDLSNEIVDRVNKVDNFRRTQHNYFSPWSSPGLVQQNFLSASNSPRLPQHIFSSPLNSPRLR